MTLCKIWLPDSGRFADNCDMTDKRQDIRDLCADLLDIHWTDSKGKIHDEIATLEDISPSGACIKMDHRIKINSVIDLKYPGGKFVGLIKYCKREPIGYYIGVEFQEGYLWDRRKYKPEHLLQLRLKLVKNKK
jgi:hypothetical protein